LRCAFRFSIEFSPWLKDKILPETSSAIVISLRPHGIEQEEVSVLAEIEQAGAGGAGNGRGCRRNSTRNSPSGPEREQMVPRFNGAEVEIGSKPIRNRAITLEYELKSVVISVIG
jgi:hypothetical protein